MFGKEGALFHVEIRRGLYLISSSRSGPTEDGRSLAPGQPTSNSYLVVGEEEALLFDLAVNEPGLKEYAQNLAGRPLKLVLSHGHPDHVYNLAEFTECWMHPADEKLIRDGMPGFAPVNPCPEIHPLRTGDIIDIGRRTLEVIHIPGHTPGSIVLLDHTSHTLLSGDTCARRLLYGLTDFVPIDQFCNSLRRLEQQDFDVIYSAHDRCALPKAYLSCMLRVIADELPDTQTTVELPGLGTMARLEVGDVYSLRYFDMALPLEYLDSLRRNAH